MRRALWAGEWIDGAEIPGRMAPLCAKLEHGLPRALEVRTVLEACEKLSQALLSPSSPELARELQESLQSAGVVPEEAHGLTRELGEFLRRENLELKIRRELASGAAQHFPFRLERISYREDQFEAWAPLGVLVHITPTNAPNVPFLSVLEGLLTGNVCFLKTGGGDPEYPLLALRALVELDSTGLLKEFVYAARISSRDQGLMRQVLAVADGIAVWGSEEAVAAVRELAPPHARIIDWGHKLSLAYLASDLLASPGLDTVLKAFARDVCQLEQQACSSPQVLYVDTSSEKELREISARLARILEEVSSLLPRARMPAPAEQAELTRTRLVAELETCLANQERRGVVEVLRGECWTLLVDTNPGMKASPLFRTLWIKPLPESEILPVLRPLRRYLQTVGLGAARSSLGRLTRLFLRSGALRIAPPGGMLDGYIGEPHDGVYALQRYSRRVSLRVDSNSGSLRGFSGLDELEPSFPATSLPTGNGRESSLPILTKEDLANQEIAPRDCELYFKSGGSSGEPKLSVFTYDDYHQQMKLAAQGLYAAGLDPRTDRCMNLFFGGGLYGGFLSFFSILEELRAVQFPMSAHADLATVSGMIVQGKVNTLLGMPSYLIQLFRQNESVLKDYRGVQKVFFAGEHFSDAQKNYLVGEFGVALIRSAAYGGNDTGPMGFQCEFCEGTVHHLLERLHSLEILKSSPQDEAGRLILSSHARRGQHLTRYDLGDLGRWLPEGDACPCGRPGRRFELLGRHGDVFKAGGSLLSYGKFARALSERLSFSGEFQLKLEHRPMETLTLLYGNSGTPLAPAVIRQACLEGYADLEAVVHREEVVDFQCRAIPPRELSRAPGSGKLRHILDHRSADHPFTDGASSEPLPGSKR